MQRRHTKAALKAESGPTVIRNLRVTKQTSLYSETENREGKLYRVHYVVKGTPFLLYLDAEGDMDIADVEISATLYFWAANLEESKEVQIPSGAPIEYQVHHTGTGQATLEVRIRVLSTQLQGSLFVVQVRVQDEVVTSEPIKSVSKLEQIKRKIQGTKQVDAKELEKRTVPKKRRRSGMDETEVTEQLQNIHECQQEELGYLKKVLHEQKETKELVSSLVSESAPKRAKTEATDDLLDDDDRDYDTEETDRSFAMAPHRHPHSARDVAAATDADLAMHLNMFDQPKPPATSSSSSIVAGTAAAAAAAVTVGQQQAANNNNNNNLPTLSTSAEIVTLMNSSEKCPLEHVMHKFLAEYTGLSTAARFLIIRRILKDPVDNVALSTFYSDLNACFSQQQNAVMNGNRVAGAIGAGGEETPPPPPHAQPNGGNSVCTCNNCPYRKELAKIEGLYDDFFAGGESQANM